MNQLPRITRALQLATRAHQAGQLAQAERHYAAALDLDPRQFDALHLLGLVRWQQQRNDEALQLIRRALSANPSSAEGWSNLGIVFESLGRNAEALGAYDRALALNPRYAKALCHRGDALRALARLEDALASYEAALGMAPNLLQAWINRGVTLKALGRLEDALACYDRLVAVNPQLPEAHYNRGNCLDALERHEEAVAAFDCALVLRPNYAEAWSNRGNSLNRLARYEEALASCERALTLEPRLAEALCNRGNALEGLNRHENALACHDAAIAIKPTLAQAFSSRGNALSALGRSAEALESFERALAIAPGSADINYNCGLVLAKLGRHLDAIAAFERALALDPGHRHAVSSLASSQLAVCDWDAIAKLAEQIPALVAEGRAIIDPFTCVAYGLDASIQQACARNFTRSLLSWTGGNGARGGEGSESIVAHSGLMSPARGGEGRLKIAYLSADFRQHAVATTIAELIELHDRRRFEVIGLSFGPDDGSELRARLTGSFDVFHDVRGESDHTAAERLRRAGIHIAIDLMGYTHRCRPRILGARPTPVQVSWLGYPGTLAAPFIDYVLADRFVLPFRDQPFYDERIVHLPDSYQPNDSQRAISPKKINRGEAGLPEEAFVFCCFNNSYKLSRTVFRVWMRLLERVPHSVLWLYAEDAPRDNLRREAEAAGIDVRRLIFMEKIEHGQYLARHALADLFLDTVPYNAHATGSNALWAGLPLLTVRGTTFAGRVGESLLNAAGLSELVAKDLDEYEAIALSLATDPGRLARFRRKLAENRTRCSLFDTARFARHIEAAYLRMWELHESGEAPRSFAVEPTS